MITELAQEKSFLNLLLWLFCLPRHKWKFIIFFPAAGDINDVMIKTLTEAHATTNIKLEDLQAMFRKPQVGFGSAFPPEGKIPSHWGCSH